MKTFSKVALGSIFAISLFACNRNNAGTAAIQVKSGDVSPKDERESLVGQYGLHSDGKIVPMFRVVHQPSAQEFVMQEWGTGDWQGATNVGHPLKDEEFNKLKAAGLPDSAIALRFDKMILVKVSKDDAGKLGGSTGFALLSEIGPIELTLM